jgi:hypothetical protein
MKATTCTRLRKCCCITLCIAVILRAPASYRLFFPLSTGGAYRLCVIRWIAHSDRTYRARAMFTWTRAIIVPVHYELIPTETDLACGLPSPTAGRSIPLLVVALDHSFTIVLLKTRLLSYLSVVSRL